MLILNYQGWRGGSERGHQLVRGNDKDSRKEEQSQSPWGRELPAAQCWSCHGRRNKFIIWQLRTGVSTTNPDGKAWGTPGSESECSGRGRAGDASAQTGTKARGFMTLTSSESGQGSAYLVVFQCRGPRRLPSGVTAWLRHSERIPAPFTIQESSLSSRPNSIFQSSSVPSQCQLYAKYCAWHH